MAPVTLRDVAAAAGVSVSTVSKVVRGQAKGAQLSDLTVERVRDMVVQLGYVPNQVARSLRAQSTRQIGLVLGSMAVPGVTALTLNGGLLVGLSAAARECHLPAVVLYPQDDAMADPSPYLDGRIDGLLVRCPKPTDEALLRLLAPSHLPLVAVWSQAVLPGVGYCDVDHHGGAMLAVGHLLELGHRRVAYVGPPLNYDDPHFAGRYTGYQQALREAGVLPQPEWHVADGAALLDLLVGPEPVTAAFATTDLRAAALAADLARAGLRIPEHLSLVGFDNLASADHIAGGLTTIHQPIAEMAAQAVRNLVALIGGAPAEECRTILPAYLVVRHSTARTAAV